MSVAKIMVNETELKFTFNSFKYMQEFSGDSFADLKNHPFKIISLTSMLLLGALNNNPATVYSEEFANSYIETYCETNNISMLFADLSELLQESSFFKSLQKTPTPKKTK